MNMTDRSKVTEFGRLVLRGGMWSIILFYPVLMHVPMSIGTVRSLTDPIPPLALGLQALWLLLVGVTVKLAGGVEL